MSLLSRVRAPLLLAGALGLAPSVLRAAGAGPGPERSPALRSFLAADSCPRGRISSVFIDNHSVFDTTDPALEGRFLWLFELANTLHMDTRRSFIRRELLFSEGECMDPLLLRESERLLREQGFIAKADVFALDQPDGTEHVIVDTQDEWTTKLDLGLTFEGGLQIEVIELTEENFLGRGMTMEVSFSQRREQKDFGFRLADPQLFNTRWDGQVSMGRTRAGNEWEEQVIYPFVGEVGRVAGRHRLGHGESLFAYSTANAEFTNVTVPVDREIFEITGARRFGRPGRFTVVGGGVLRESTVFPGFPSSPEVVHDGDFDASESAPDSVAALLVDQSFGRSATRLNVIFGLRRLEFTRRTGLDALRGVQDVPVGWRAALSLGRSLDVLGEGDVDPSDDVVTRMDVFAGAVPGNWVVAGGFEVEGRKVLGGEDTGRGWRDLLTEAQLFAYLQPGGDSRHTLFGEARFTGGWQVVTPFQLTLGGRSALRGFGEDDFPGGQRFLLNLEDRILLSGPFSTLLDLGVTLFADAGAVWDGGVPFGIDSGLKGSVGAGLRLGFPSGSRSVLRADLAFPLGGGGRSGGPVFRVVLNELLGFTGGFRDAQLSRSRRATVNTEFQGVSR